MPRTTNRKKCAKELIYGFLNYLKIRAKQAALWHHRQRRFLRRIAPVDPYAPVELAVEALDSEMSTSSTSSTETRTYLDSTWISDMFGSESESESSSDLDAGLDAPSLFSTSSAGSGSRSDLSSISGESENEEEDLLLPLVVSDEDSDSDTEGEISGNGDWAHQADFNTDDSTNSMGSESSGSDDGNSADIEDWDDFEAPRMSTTAKLARGVRNEYEAMYASRYEVPRTHFPKPPADLPHVLKVYKTLRPDHFRMELRVTPRAHTPLIKSLKKSTTTPSSPMPPKIHKCLLKNNLLSPSIDLATLGMLLALMMWLSGQGTQKELFSWLPNVQWQLSYGGNLWMKQSAYQQKNKKKKQRNGWSQSHAKLGEMGGVW
jgi:hypothetical protein